MVYIRNLHIETKCRLFVKSLKQNIFKNICYKKYVESAFFILPFFRNFREIYSSYVLEYIFSNDHIKNSLKLVENFNEWYKTIVKTHINYILINRFKISKLYDLGVFSVFSLKA